MKSENKPPRQLLLENKIGSTDLEKCGWCVYARGSFDTKYNYCIEGYCEIVKFRNRSIKWDTVCKLKNTSISEIEGIIKYQKTAIVLHEEAIKERKHYLDVLDTFLTKANDCPKLPEDREEDHFKHDDMVAVWITSAKQWFFGKVVNVSEGFVTYLLNGIGPVKSPFWGCGFKGPFILLKSEYNYFIHNPNMYNLWQEKTYLMYEEGCIFRAPII